MLLFWFHRWKTAGGDKGEEGEAEENQGNGQVEYRHENENQDGSDGGNDDLGKVLAEERSQVLRRRRLG